MLFFSQTSFQSKQLTRASLTANSPTSIPPRTNNNDDDDDEGGGGGEKEEKKKKKTLKRDQPLKPKTSNVNF